MDDLATRPNLVFQESDIAHIDCLDCGGSLALGNVETVSPRFDLRTYACNCCSIQETFVVERVEKRC